MHGPPEERQPSGLIKRARWRAAQFFDAAANKLFGGVAGKGSFGCAHCCGFRLIVKTAWSLLQVFHRVGGLHGKESYPTAAPILRSRRWPAPSRRARIIIDVCCGLIAAWDLPQKARESKDALEFISDDLVKPGKRVLGGIIAARLLEHWNWFFGWAPVCRRYCAADHCNRRDLSRRRSAGKMLPAAGGRLIQR